MAFLYFSRLCRRRAVAAWLAVLLWAGVGPQAQADSIVLDAKFGEETRSIHVETIEHAGMTYICLSEAVRQFGGSSSLLPSRVQVDLNSQRARIRLNGTEVSSSLGPHSLRYPAIEKSGRVYLALADLRPFFARSFRVTVTDRGQLEDAAASAADDAAPDGTRVSSRELLEPVEPDSLATMPLDDLVEEPDGLAPLPDRMSTPIGQPTRPTDNEAATPAHPSPTEQPVASGTLTPDPLTRIRCIVIDPGHGGNDTGAVGQNGLTEKDFVLALALKTQKAIQERVPVRVLVTRTQDICPPVETRSLYANHPQNRVDLFISLHTGAGLSPSAQGAEGFCTPEPSTIPTYGTEERRTFRRDVTNAYWSRHIASSVIDSVATATNVPSRGVHALPCRVLAPLTIPGFLMEVGFLTNSEEAARLDTEAYQDQLAGAIADGLVSYCVTAAPEPAPSPAAPATDLEEGTL